MIASSQAIDTRKLGFVAILLGVAIALALGVGTARADELAPAEANIDEPALLGDVAAALEAGDELPVVAPEEVPAPNDSQANAPADPQVDDAVLPAGDEACADLAPEGEPSADEAELIPDAVVDPDAADGTDGDEVVGDEPAGEPELEEGDVEEGELAEDDEVVLLLAANEKSGLNGIDISGWNPTIEISKLGDTDFVIIKATEYNNSTKTYTSYVPRMKEWADAVIAQGKLLGFYHFATMPSYHGQTMQMQADAFVEAIRPYLGKAVLVLDWEDTNYSKLQTNVGWAKEWLDRVYKTTGVRPLIYTSNSVTREVDWTPVAKDYKLWGAQYLNDYYNETTPIKAYVENPRLTTLGWGAWGSRPTIYQYTSTARINGYNYNVDVNRFYGTRSEWQAMAKKNSNVIIAKNGWYYENGSYHHYANNKLHTGWLVTGDNINGTVGGLQRYWLGSNGNLRTNQLIDPNTANGKGAGYFAFATSVASGKGGYVVRGKYLADSGNVYLADNDGKLENPGWLVTSKYDGTSRRYYIDSKAHGAVPGFSTAGYLHYTLPKVGYVATGNFTDANGLAGTADSTGKITRDPRKFTGWRVTSEFGHGLQRYWFRNGTMIKSALLPASETGWWAYARPEGYVVRGKYVASNGNVYLANNDGKLENPGWLVTNKYDGSMQRYWIDSKAHAAVPGYSNDGWRHYTIPGKGYVARGAFTDSNGKSGTANNDGKIITEGKGKTGWVVSSSYGHGLQRYWFRDGVMVKDQLLKASETGWWAYARPEGYVVRGRWKHPVNENVYLADNDGRLENPGWLVTSKYGQGLQRYYIESSSHACEPGYSSHGWNHVTRFDGPVVRGKYVALNGTIYLADNDGRLEMGGSGKGGWLTTSKYDGGVTRKYWVDASTHGVIPGMFTTGGKSYYSQSGVGYILTNSNVVINGKSYSANNAGVLTRN